MVFHSDVVLVQFRIPRRETASKCIRDLGTENPTERDARASRSGRGPMRFLLERNGASPLHVGERLASAGFRLVDAHAHVRFTKPQAFKSEKPYRLVTFVFAKDGETAKGGVAGVFRTFARRRYEYVTVNEGGDDGRSVIAVLCKTVADRAVQLARLDDEEAGSFGIVVSRAVRKEERQPKVPQPVAAAPVPTAPKKTPQGAASARASRFERWPQWSSSSSDPAKPQGQPASTRTGEEKTPAVARTPASLVHLERLKTFGVQPIWARPKLV